MLKEQASKRDERLGWPAFALIGAANLALLWWYPHPPTLDGPCATWDMGNTLDRGHG